MQPPSIGLALRSLFWTLLFPGFFAGYVPWRWFGVRDVVLDARQPLHWPALAAIGLGVLLLAACVIEFARRGHGTLSPADPPTRLVVEGPYRWVRNPMYLAVTLVLLGQALLTRSRGLLLYWVLWFTAVNLFIRGYEEPALQRQFGAAYDRYRAAVRRWIPRSHPWNPES